MTGRRGLAVAGAAIVGLAGLFALVEPRLAWRPNTGSGVFDNKAAFTGYVEGLRLESLDIEQAAERLRTEGFQCALLEPGNLGCHRSIQGSSCGERQFVDVRAVDREVKPLRVATRFGLACK